MTVLVVLAVAGCERNGPRSSGSSNVDGPGPEMKDWPVSTSDPDRSPRDLLRRYYTALKDGNSREFLACYAGNDPAYIEVYLASFNHKRAQARLMSVLDMRYGKGASKQFLEIGPNFAVPDLQDANWPASGRMAWDGESSEADWFAVGKPRTEERPERLRLLNRHWCFIFTWPGDSSQVGASLQTLERALQRTGKAIRAAHKGPKEYTLEQVWEIYWYGELQGNRK